MWLKGEYMKKHLKLFSILIVTLAFLAGCTSDDTTNETTSEMTTEMTTVADEA